MKIVILKERMDGEGRVALTPNECWELVRLGHKVFVERRAGEKSGFEDYHYCQSGAKVLSLSEMIPLLLPSPDITVLKVKQPIPEDDVWLTHMRNGVLFAYFHSTGEKDQRTIDILLNQKITAISYENIEKNGTYPLLSPMSEIAGRLAVEWGVEFLKTAREKAGVKQLKNRCYQMVVCGAGVVGYAAIKKALNLGFSRIAVFEKDAEKERFLCEHLTKEEMGRICFFLSGNPDYQGRLKHELGNAHLVVGAVLVPGGHAPVVVSEEQVRSMSKGSVIVDVAVDQGGCIWHPENETENTFEFDRKIFVRVPNMPGSVPKEATPILAGAVFPYLLDVLREGAESALVKDVGLQKGLLTYGGEVMNKKAAEHWGEWHADPYFIDL